MGNLATVALALAARPDLDSATTLGWSYQTTSRPANSLMRGRIDPSQALDFSSAKSLAESMVRRYGQGFGHPFELDPSVAPAISVLPSDTYALRGWTEGENLELPLESTCQQLGIHWPLDDTDVEDARALGNFVERVVRPLNRGLAIGADWHSAVSAGHGDSGGATAASTPGTAAAPAPTTVLPVGEILVGLAKLSGISAGVQDLQHRLTQAPAAVAPSASPVAALGGDVLELARTAQKNLKSLPPDGGGRWARQLGALAAAVLAPK